MYLEQLRDSMGPPPLDVPRNVTDIGCGMMNALKEPTKE